MCECDLYLWNFSGKQKLLSNITQHGEGCVCDCTASLWENSWAIYHTTWHFPEIRHPNFNTTTSCTGEEGHINSSTWHYVHKCSCDKLCDGLHTPFPKVAKQWSGSLNQFRRFVKSDQSNPSNTLLPFFWGKVIVNMLLETVKDIIM